MISLSIAGLKNSYPTKDRVIHTWSIFTFQAVELLTHWVAHWNTPKKEVQLSSANGLLKSKLWNMKCWNKKLNKHQLVHVWRSSWHRIISKICSSKSQTTIFGGIYHFADHLWETNFSNWNNWNNQIMLHASRQFCFPKLVACFPRACVPLRLMPFQLYHSSGARGALSTTPWRFPYFKLPFSLQGKKLCLWFACQECKKI